MLLDKNTSVASSSATVRCHEAGGGKLSHPGPYPEAMTENQTGNPIHRHTASTLKPTQYLMYSELNPCEGVGMLQGIVTQYQPLRGSLELISRAPIPIFPSPEPPIELELLIYLLRIVIQCFLLFNEEDNLRLHKHPRTELNP